MKKLLLCYLLFAMTGVCAAQSMADNLKNILKNHTEQDTFRVNRLNQLALNSTLTPDERKKYATEALTISDKIKYTLGRGNALVGLGTVKGLEKKPEEAKALFIQADNIAKQTRNKELQATVLWKSSFLLEDANEKVHQLQRAFSLAKKIDNYGLQA